MLKAFTHIFPGARAVHRRVRPGRARRRGGRRARRRPDDALEGNASDDALEGNAPTLAARDRVTSAACCGGKVPIEVGHVKYGLVSLRCLMSLDVVWCSAAC